MVHRPRWASLRPPAQVLERGVGVHGPREQEALARAAPELAQSAPLLGELDPLGHDLELQRLPERDDGGGERRGLGDAPSRRNERSILRMSTGKRLR